MIDIYQIFISLLLVIYIGKQNVCASVTVKDGEML